MTTKRDLEKECVRLREALHDILGSSTHAVPGQSETAWYAIGRIQSSACIALGLEWDEWRRSNEKEKA